MWSAESDLRSAGRLGRRAAGKRLEEANIALASANDHVDGMSERARPTKEHLDRLEKIVYSWEDKESTRQILDEWYDVDGQAATAELRFKALDTWRRWASGFPLDGGEMRLLAGSMATFESRIARLLESTLPADGLNQTDQPIEAPRETALGPTIDPQLP